MLDYMDKWINLLGAVAMTALILCIIFPFLPFLVVGIPTAIFAMTVCWTIVLDSWKK